MKRMLFSALIGTLISLACLSSPATPTSTPTIDFQSTRAKEQENQQATARAQAALESQKLTATAVAQAARESTSQAATQAVFAEATTVASNMWQEVNDLYSDRIISSAEGDYYQLADFDESWAQINWYQWWETGFTPSNFVVRTNMSWDSASNTANWFSSGCGMVFREQDEDNHYIVFLALDGYVYLNGYKNGRYASFGKGWIGKLDLPKGSAEFQLAVDQDWITVFVNGKQVLRKQEKSFSDGKLALTLSSGTNKDYGTRCQMTDIELWELY